MTFSKVTVAGSGTLGSQIAFQSAYSGKEVVVYDINDDILEQARVRMNSLAPEYVKDLNSTDQQLKDTFNRLSYNSNLEDAVKHADIIIEAIPERIDIKEDFYSKLAKVAPKETVFTTNTSTLLPSQFAKFTGRPEKFLALHFANKIWLNNVAEIMKHEGTDSTIFQDVIAFAKEIGMITIPIEKEQPGYVMNSLLVPLIEAGEELWVNGITDPHTIDKTWMIATGAPRGPFAILDYVGLNTNYNINLAKDTELSRKIAQNLKENYIDKGKLGIQTGEGFYKYPNPEYLKENFLKN